jgi:hypothetical protein
MIALLQSWLNSNSRHRSIMSRSVGDRLLGFLAVLTITLLQLAVSAPALAQYMYMDTNANGIHDPGDRLNSVGDSTVVDIWLNTNTNQNGSAAQCNVNPGTAMAINSYAFNVVATGGTATYRNYINRQTVAFPNRAEVLNRGDGTYKNAFYSFSYTPAGLHRLGTLTITGTGGSPHIDFVDQISGAQDFTSFGTQCAGHDGDNTYRLGIDWHDVAGCGSSSEGSGALTVVVPAQADLEIGAPVGLVGEFSGIDPSDTISVDVRGLPPGLLAVDGWQFDGSKQARLYGRLGAGVSEGATYDVAWSASDGAQTRIAHTLITARPMVVDPGELLNRVTDLVTANYIHGMPKLEVRSLGSAALPILAQMLRQEERKDHWINVALAIGLIGDTAYFDTLRAFVWDRFQGPIDRSTFMAIRSAQGSLSAMATMSPRALEYLITTANPSAWTFRPWTFAHESSSVISTILATESLIALAYTDSERASEIIRSVPIPADRNRSIFARDLHGTHQRVRMKGYVKEWEDQEARGRGGVR